MLILLTLHIINRFRKGNELSIDLNKIIDQLITKLKYVLPFLLISFTSGDSLTNESETIRFDIIKKYKTLGYIDLQKLHSNETTTYRIQSEVNTKFLIEFKASSKETYVYENDTLIYSSIYRTVNDRVKVDQSLSYNQGNYYLKQKKGNQLLNTGVIKCNLILLFFEEPVNIQQVYCDKLNLNLKIQKLEPNRYKITFPNKSYTIFYYRDGRCRLIEAVGSFYRVKLIPNYQL